MSMDEGGCNTKVFKEGGFYGYKVNGEWLIKPLFESLKYTCEFWIGSKGGKFGIISKNGEDLTEFEYDGISNFMNYAILKKNLKMGVFSIEENKLVFSVEFDKITFFE
jgi:hypothetical protein